MRGKRWFIAVGISLALILLIAGVVHAQEPMSPEAQPEQAGPRRPAVHRGWRYEEASALVILADTLEMPLADLVAALKDGTTIADLAEERGIELDTIIDAVMAPRAEVLARFVEAELLTQERADTLLDRMQEGLELRFTHPRVVRRLEVMERALAARRWAKRIRHFTGR